MNTDPNANVPLEFTEREKSVPTVRRVESAKELPRLAYDLHEAAQMLNVSEKTVRRLVDRGLLKASRGIRHLLFTREALEKYLEKTTL